MTSRRFQIQRNQKLYCRKPVQYGTKKYDVGDVFPYKKLEVNWRRVVDMFSALTLIGENDICFDDVMEQKRIRLGKVKDSVEEVKPVVELSNRGRGWYHVFVDGEQYTKKCVKKKKALRLQEELTNG